MSILSTVTDALPLPALPYPAKVVQHKLRMRMLDGLALVLNIDEPRLFVGIESSLALARSIAAAGHRRVLLVTDEGLTALGLYDGVVGQLEALGVEVRVYDAVSPNPTQEQMDAGTRIAQEGGAVDAVIAVGGGSPMDAAKIIAAGVTNDMTAAEMEGILKIRKRPLPLYAIPTTAGTGSETTLGAVVTNAQERRKYTVADPRFIPVAAALDPTLMVGLPPAITAATGMDALTHAIEASISTRSTAAVRTAGATATSMIFDNLRTAVEDGSDLVAREAMSLAAFEAGVALSTAALGYVHALSHQLSGLYHTPHGVANSVLLPGVLRASQPNADAALADLAVAADLATARESVTIRATRFVDAVEQLREDVAVPGTLKEIEEADLPLIAERAMDETFMYNAVPRYLRERELMGIVRAVAAG